MSTALAGGTRGFPAKRILLFAVAAVVWLFFLVRTCQVLTVGSAHVTIVNSDAAIAILMSNEDRPATAYNTYYYGQDRFGAWPFLIAQSIHRATGHHWSDRALITVETVWLFISIPLLWAMSRRDPLGGLLFLLPLCLHVTSRRNLFDLSQSYAWQITALMFGWWGLRRLCEDRSGLAGDKRRKIESFAWGLLTFWFALLAVLSSPVSGPLLFFLLALEISRSAQKTGGGQTLKSLGGRFLQNAVPVLAAVLTEMLLRANYHRYSLKHFGRENRTLIALDAGHLTENLANQWARFADSPWWLLSLLPPLVFAALSAYYIHKLRSNKGELRATLCRLFTKDNAVMVTGMFGMGFINFIITVLVSHVRTNFYDARYLTLSYLFISFAGLLTLPLLADSMKRYRRPARYAVAVSALAFLLFKFPTPKPDTLYPVLTETARHLSQEAPSTVLLGGYWETYVFAGLDPKGSLIPVPAYPPEGETLRTPWTVAALSEADEVVVENHLPAFGGPDSPAPRLVQYGVPLRLVAPRWYVNGKFVFSIYKNESRQP